MRAHQENKHKDGITDNSTSDLIRTEMNSANSSWLTKYLFSDVDEDENNLGIKIFSVESVKEEETKNDIKVVCKLPEIKEEQFYE